MMIVKVIFVGNYDNDVDDDDDGDDDVDDKEQEDA